ncbi:MlaD family protein [[Mycobacterium] wendilense]|uniref:MlaD family protein n=1 Tax=[Mycobacterium] wendilense TaxID=3064284 RepID=A0ABM9MGN0_9MYCO|nr:MlaD family protein [Mycolicibacterium sp. MU0050]CAJ1584611.1 MlaD family protein [Mycolicibacterium sp. MU0050]
MSINLTPRATRTAAATLTVVALAAAGTACASPRSESAEYCTLLPDTVGLYVGNPVTQMGYPIGTVKSIDAGPAHVRVGFSVTEQRALPADVKAVVRSPSILADRSLELVGNYSDGPQLDPGSCIAPERSFSPKTLSEVIGSADTMLNAINDSGSTNIADTVGGLDRLTHNNGVRGGQLVSATSALLDSPDQAISDLGTITDNLGDLTGVLVDSREPLKEIIVDLPATAGDLVVALDGTARLAGADEELGTLGPLLESVAVLETRLGDETQITLDSVSAAVRKVTPHANALAGLFDPVPWWIDSIAQNVNHRQFNVFNIAYRPPMFRVRAPDGLALCGFMNSSMPGSCADVHGTPYAVDVALLQYVLQQASRS